MSKRNYSELGSLQTAFETLQRMNSYLFFPLDEEKFDIPALTDYFESPFDSQIEAIVEDVLSIAAARAVYDNPYIPKFNKERCAKNTARYFRQALRVAKIEHHAQEKGLTVKEYNQRMSSLTIVEKAKRIERFKNVGKRLSISYFANAVAGHVGSAVVFATRIIWGFMPDKTRKNMKERAIEMIKNTVTTIQHVSNEISCEFRKTPVGQKVEKVIDKVKPVLKDFYETKMKPAGQIFNKVRKNVLDFAKSFLPF